MTNNTRTELIKALRNLSVRLAYNPKIKLGDRDIIEKAVNYLSFQGLYE